MGLVQDLRAKEAGCRMGSGSQARRQGVGWVQDSRAKEVGCGVSSGPLRQGGRIWNGFRIAETRRQGMGWVQDYRDKEVGHGVSSGSQRQGGRVWGGFSLQNPQSLRDVVRILFSLFNYPS